MKYINDTYSDKTYLYKSDLEKFKTKDLIYILRSCRRWLNNMLNLYDLTDKELNDIENTWIPYTHDYINNRYNNKYTMIWMVKDVLSHREHVPTSKQEKKKIRQDKAKHAKTNR